MRSLTDRKPLIERCQGLAAEGRPIEEIIAFLRAEGCQKTETIGLITEALGIALARAKEIVHFSASWADVRERDEKFHETLVQTIKSVPDGELLEQERKK
jgi:hypothetical protein